MVIFLDLIALIGCLQAMILAGVILTNKVFHNHTNRPFAYFLLLLAIIGFDSRLSRYYSGLGPFWELFFDIVGDDIPWIMLVYLPLFKFFLDSTKVRLSFPFWTLTLPFFIFLMINAFIDLDMEFGIRSIPFFTEHRMIFYQLEDYLSLGLFSALHLFGFFKLARKSGNKWLVRLWWYTSLLIVLWGALTLDQTFFEDAFFKTLEMSLWTFITIFVYWLMYSGLFQFNLANNRQEIRSKLKTNFQENTPKKTGLSTKSKAYFDQLMELMIVNKAYRNPDLGREMVAEEIGISISYLTQLIKEYSKKNFTGFINDFRVEDVKKMLVDPKFDNYDHLSIGLEAGFKSKSAYYTTFKSLTGKTPAAYKKDLS